MKESSDPLEYDRTGNFSYNILVGFHILSTIVMGLATIFIIYNIYKFQDAIHKWNN